MTTLLDQVDRAAPRGPAVMPAVAFVDPPQNAAERTRREVFALIGDLAVTHRWDVVCDSDNWKDGVATHPVSEGRRVEVRFNDHWHCWQVLAFIPRDTLPASMEAGDVELFTRRAIAWGADDMNTFADVEREVEALWDSRNEGERWDGLS